jgi:hypothetical protein
LASWTQIEAILQMHKRYIMVNTPTIASEVIPILEQSITIKVEA